MSSKLIDLYRKIIKYNDKSVFIAFDINGESYYHIKQLCVMLGYKDTKDAINKHMHK